jgi:glycosyltransferase involved in cell wall biosynthesis
MSKAAVATRTVWNHQSFGLVARRIADFRPDVLHCHNIFPLLSPSVYYAARRAGVAVVQTLHNYRLLCLKATLFLGTGPCDLCVGQTIPWPGVARRCYHDSIAHSASVAGFLVLHRMLGTWRREVDLFVAVSAFARSKYLEGGFDPDRVVVKPNVVGGRPSVGSGEGGFAVIVGRLSEEKGLQTVVAAWMRSPDNPPLVVVGDGPLRSLEKQFENDQRVRFVGHQARAEVYDLMGRASFLVAASQCYETFGLSIIEAFACGTPVVAARIGAFTELVEEGITGFLFEPGDVDSLQSAIDRMMASPSCHTLMRSTVRSRFEDVYDMERNYRALIDIYEQARARMQHRARASPCTAL